MAHGSMQHTCLHTVQNPDIPYITYKLSPTHKSCIVWQILVCTSHLLYESHFSSALWKIEKRLTAVRLLPIWEIFSSSLKMLSAAQCACTRTWSMEGWTRYTCIARRGGMTFQLPCFDGLWRLSASRHKHSLVGDLLLPCARTVTTVCIKARLHELIQRDS